MKDYNELVAALRCVELRLSCNECEYGTWSESGGLWSCELERKDTDAADAIEALQAEEKSRKENCEKCADATRRTIIDLQGIIADLRAQISKRGEWISKEELNDMFANPL